MSTEVPDGWEERELNDLIDPLRPICYGVLKPGEEDPHGVPLIRIVDMENNKVSTQHLFSISKKLDSEFERSRLDGGELLISIQGTVGLVAVVPPQLKGANISRTVARVNIVRANVEYIRQFLMSGYGQKRIQDVIMGTTRDSLNISSLRKIKVLLPKLLSEQNKITAILLSIDSTIDKTKALIEKYKKMKHGLMQDLLIGQSSNWMIVSLSKVTTFISRGKSPEYTDNSDNLIINQACIYWDDFKFENLKRVSPSFWSKLSVEYITKEGDIFINSTGTGTIGRAQFLDFEKRFTWDSHVTVVRTTERVVPRFLFYILQTPLVQTQIDIHCITGSTNQIELSRERLKEIKIRIPEKPEEQEIIAERIHSVERKIKSEQLYLDKLIKMKTGMMEDLLTGRVRVAA